VRLWSSPVWQHLRLEDGQLKRQQQQAGA